jgi:hypothetical protein
MDVLFGSTIPALAVMSHCSLLKAVRHKLERIWKELVVVESRCYPRICLKVLRKPTKHFRIESAPAEIRTEHFRNASLECYL